MTEIEQLKLELHDVKAKKQGCDNKINNLTYSLMEKNELIAALSGASDKGLSYKLQTVAANKVITKLMAEKDIFKARFENSKKYQELTGEITKLKREVESNEGLRDAVNRLTAENGKHLRVIKRLTNKL